MNPATLTAQDAWLAALGQLQLQLHHTTYSTWFQGTKCIGYQDGVMTIQARMESIADELNARYLEACQKTVKQIWRQEVAIRFTAQPSSMPTLPAVAVHDAPDWEAMYREAQTENTALRQENTELKREVAYLSEWGGGVASQITSDGVFIPRAVLNQVVDTLLNSDTAPRTSALVFLYVLSRMDENGVAKLEATDVSQNVLKMKNRRSWANLLGPIFGNVVYRDGRDLRINVTTHRYTIAESNDPPLQSSEPAPSESNDPPLQGEKLSPPTVTLPENVTTGRHNSPVIMNDDDINKKSSSIEDNHQSSEALLPETAKRLDERKRQLHAMQFNPKMAERFMHTITYTPQETWDSWLEQADRGKNPAALMCDKIKSQAEKTERKVIDLRNRKRVG